MNSLLQLFRNMSPLKIAAIVLSVIILLAGLVAIITRSSIDNFVPLYSELDIKDSNAVVTELEARSIPFQLRAGGTEILVPEAKVLRLRMSMAEAGIPSKGSIVGYEIFDHSEALGSSNFVQNVNLIRALEGELARTISSFKNIGSARVHLVLPKRDLFSREKQDPSASVVLSVKGSSALSREQINGISNLIATAVPNLEASRITIVDTHGHALKSGAGNADDPGYIASSNEEFKISYENRLKNTIEELLAQSVGGPGHVKAQVSTEMNFDRIVTNSETFDPDGQVIRSVQETTDKETSTEKEANDNVSSANNIPAGQKTEANSAQNVAINEHTDTTTNYEISKTVKNHISETGTVKRLSIAVLVDGIYTVDAKTQAVSYTPRTPDELNKYTALVKSAVGFDPARNDKLEVVNMQFVSDLSLLKEKSEIELIKERLPELIQTAVIGLIVLIVLLAVVRPIAMRAFEFGKNDLLDTSSDAMHSYAGAASSTPGGNVQSTAAGEAGPAGVDLNKIDARFKAGDFNRSINEIADRYPQETLTTLRKWMNKE